MSDKNVKKLTQSEHILLRIPPIDIQPATGITRYSLEDFIELRDKLNSTKSKLDAYYLGSKYNQKLSRAWSQFQGIIDLYKSLRFEIEKKYNAQLVSNAWLKYYEIYIQYDLVPKKDRVIAFFNAELPGAALCAFNHYMITNSRDFDWRASSLAPSEENNMAALGDRYGLYENNKDKWLMSLTGGGNNGDSTIVSNILDFASKVGPKSPIGGVDIYSHDAGIDVSTDTTGNLGFNAQELANAKIHLGCALAGFMTLRPGGSFIAKQYTFFETFTWNLIAIYATLFEEFYLCKPLTSRPYNSEIYLVGKGYKGIPDNIRDQLIDRLNKFDTSPMLSPDGLSPKISEIRKFAKTVFTQQINFIEENVKLFNKYRFNLNELRSELEPVRNSCISNWLKLYPVKPIDSSQHIKSK